MTPEDPEPPAQEPDQEPDQEPARWVRLGREPVVQAAVFAFALAALFVLDRLTRPGPDPRTLPSVLGPAALIALALFAAGWLAMRLRRLVRRAGNHHDGTSPELPPGTRDDPTP